MNRVWALEGGRFPTATITRTVPISVGDISAAGCLLQSVERISEGTVGTLVLDLNGSRYVESIRVCRVSRLDGQTDRFQAGAQFLTIGRSRRTQTREAGAAGHGSRSDRDRACP
jgi:hypothetical protein